MSTKSLAGLCLLLCIAFTGIANNTNPKSTKSKVKKASTYKTPRYSKEVILDRLDELECPVDIRWNADVKKHIHSYTMSGRKGSELILGKSAIYFPIFEKYIEQYGLPSDLKYLSVIESALNPKVISPAGAGGLWQFMPNTARKYGLKIDNYVDERYDPHKSTEAAMKYLSALYKRFGDWTIAIAAYNCGEGRMEKAIKRGKSKDFWKIRKYLPKETQKYICKFIAATYVMHNYVFHDIHPAYPDYDLQLTKIVKVYQRKSLTQISKDTGYSLETITRLNPSYKKGIIPPTTEGSFLVLPKISS